MRLFAARQAREDSLDACIAVMIVEAQFDGRPPPALGIAAFRVQRRLAASGVYVSFERVFYRLKKRDRGKVFVR